MNFYYNNSYKPLFHPKVMQKDDKVYVAGNEGLAGSAIVRELQARNFKNLVVKSRRELDLRSQGSTEEFFRAEKPDYVFMAAAEVGGIAANLTYPADFIYDNIQMQTNVIHAAHKTGVKKLMYLGCCCAYPAQCEQPIREECLMTGRPEITNEPFAVAKLAGIKMCEAYRSQFGASFVSVIPANLFGPYDDFNQRNAHTIGMAIGLMHDAKLKGLESVTLAGTGAPMRDWLYSEDLAKACLFLMENYNSSSPINIGTGIGTSKNDIALAVKEVVGFKGNLVFDTTKPDGMLQRVLDISKIKKLGWNVESDLKKALKFTYKWFIENYDHARR